VDFHADSPNSPKFPVPAKLALLQYELNQNANGELEKVLNHTLTEIADGGIYDHLAGGFHRYSTDRFWHVPHFEKMLYDQAQLASVYLEAWRQTKNPEFKATAEGILDFVLRDMTHEDGAFYSALDAETDAIEGKYYVWEAKEIEKILGPQDAKIFGKAYGLETEKRFEHGYVLHRPQSIKETAESVRIPVSRLRPRLEQMRMKLLTARNKRKAPLMDDKILTSWNGLMIRAFADAGRLLKRGDYTEAAAKAGHFILTRMTTKEGQLVRTWRKDQPKLNAYLDDYAFLAEGLLALHQTTGEEKWLNAAKHLTDDQIKKFWDDKLAGFYFTSHKHEAMIARTKNAYDSVLPSGNSVSVRNMLRLTALTKDKSYRQKAEATLKLFAPSLQRAPRGMTNMALAQGEYLDNPNFGTPQKTESRGPVERKVLKQTSNPKPTPPVTMRAYFSVDKLPPGKTCQVVLVVNIAEGWHMNADPALPKEVMPLFELKSKLGTKLDRKYYPNGKAVAVDWNQTPVKSYDGQIRIYGVVSVPPNAAGLQEELELTLRYQACTVKSCQVPRPVTVKGKIQVAKPGEAVRAVNSKYIQHAEK